MLEVLLMKSRKMLREGKGRTKIGAYNNTYLFADNSRISLHDATRLQFAAAERS